MTEASRVNWGANGVSGRPSGVQADGQVDGERLAEQNRQQQSSPDSNVKDDKARQLGAVRHLFCFLEFAARVVKA